MLNKLDLIPEEERDRRVADFLSAYGAPEGTPCFRVSAISGDGCKPLVYALQEALENLAPAVAEGANAAAAFFPEDDDDNN